MPTTCNKLYYFVHLDEAGFPIPGTMFSTKQAKSNVCTTKIAPVTGVIMNPPAGEVACTKNPSGLRYWYLVESYIPNNPGTPQTRIVPNSMIAVRGTPSALSKQGTGGRPCSYIEWKKFEPIVQVKAPVPFVNLEAGV